MSEQLAGQLSRPDAAKTQRFLTALTEAASLLEKDNALTLGRSKDFAILVFEHDDDEAMARARSKAKRPKKK